MDSIHIIILYIKIGFAYYGQKAYKKAFAAHQRAEELLKKNSCMIANYGYDFVRKIHKLYDVPITLYCQIKDKKKALYGEKTFHRSIATVCMQLGHAYQYERSYKKAVLSYENALSQWKGIHDYGLHIDILRAYVNLEIAYIKNGQLTKAAEIHKKNFTFYIK